MGGKGSGGPHTQQIAKAIKPGGEGDPNVEEETESNSTGTIRYTNLD